MKILLLTFYFRPDLCAGSFRNTALVDSLIPKLNVDDSLDIVTTFPNRYASFDVEASETEMISEKIKISRIQLPKHKNGFLDQVVSFKTYYKEAQKLVKESNYDLVLASSSRLFTAFLGARIAKKKKAKLYLDMRDLFRENMEEIITNPLISIPLSSVLKKIEAYTFKKADKINIVSEGFTPFFKSYTKELTFFPNGIDKVFLDHDFRKTNNSDDSKLITYAGNFGDGQGLHKIIPQVAKNVENYGYKFKIIGDGGAKGKLEEKLKELEVKNVELINPVNRQQLLQYYKDTDYLFLHLNDYAAFKKVLPSKIFEYAVTEKPIIAGVGGYASEFLEKNVEGIFLFDPCDVDAFSNALINDVLKADVVNRTKFRDEFSRSNIMNKMANDILDTFRA